MFPSPIPTADATVVIERLSLVSGTRPMLRNCSLRVSAGEVATLIGPNGSGKSTLLSIVDAHATGIPPPDHVQLSGRVYVTVAARTALLPQEVRLQWVGVMGDWLASVSGDAPSLLGQYDALQPLLHNASVGLLHRYGDLLSEMERVDAWNFEARRDEVLAGLGCRPDWLTREVGTLSGGEATRVALAAILLSHADILLLDEPTNNLDGDGIAFLRDWLSTTNAATLMVSHDRAFIDAVTTSIAAIDEMTQEVTVYGGDYSFYEARRSEEQVAAERSWEEQERTRHRLLRAAGALSDRADRYNAISQDDFQRSKSKKAARQSKTLEARITRQLNMLNQPEPARRAKMTSRGGGAKAGCLVSLRGVSRRFDSRIVLTDVTLDIRGGDRILIRGANGSGKSTLLDIIGGITTPTTGSIIRASGLRLAHLHQTPDQLPAVLPLLDAIARLVDVPVDDLRPILGATIFRDVGRTAVGEISVGERRRLEVAALLAAAPDVLVLDEVTNHLDVNTIEQLELGLATYQGALVVVTHDQRFAHGLECDRAYTMTNGMLAPSNHLQ